MQITHDDGEDKVILFIVGSSDIQDLSEGFIIWPSSDNFSLRNYMPWAIGKKFFIMLSTYWFSKIA